MQGAQIIVYPEDGLYGYLFNRVTIKPYLEPIPDPWQVLPWVPCTDPGRVQPSDIMVQLSCIARYGPTCVNGMSTCILKYEGRVRQHVCKYYIILQHDYQVLFFCEIYKERGDLVAQWHVSKTW